MYWTHFLLYLALTLSWHKPHHWTRCIVTSQSTHCTEYNINKITYGYWHHCKQHKHHITCITHPWLHPHVSIPTHVSAPAYYVTPMLITYYTWTGSVMSNGIYPSVGWAACGYDLNMGTRVYVPGIGNLTCGDRPGFQPYHHIDVYGISLGTGYRDVTVYQ